MTAVTEALLICAIFNLKVRLQCCTPVLLYSEWTEELKQEADLKLARHPDRAGLDVPDSTESRTYSVHLKPGPIEVHPVQYSALR